MNELQCRFAPMDEVRVDGCTSHKYTVTAVVFRAFGDGDAVAAATYEVPWFNNEAKTAWIEEYRLSEVL